MKSLTDGQLERLEELFASYNQNVISYEQHEILRFKIINEQ